jgi:hypothetical protein
MQNNEKRFLWPFINSKSEFITECDGEYLLGPPELGIKDDVDVSKELTALAVPTFHYTA